MSWAAKEREEGVRESGPPRQVLHLRRRAPPDATVKEVVIATAAAGRAAVVAARASSAVKADGSGIRGTVLEARGPLRQALRLLQGAPPDRRVAGQVQRPR